jgi:2-polyprenyl-3-methyl-5-hydroxy-6-metoxy-1,4-benzoquinol methylase
MADLATSPPSNSYLSAEDLVAPEKWYPLKVYVCQKCWLAQTADFVEREECFSSNYAYFSSSSATWVEHARRFATDVIHSLGLNAGSLVVEVASNDGYLLRNFHAAGIPCYGVEPTESTAAVARELGIDVVGDFFGTDSAQGLLSSRGPADLIIGNNVLAHVPDINDFLRGINILLRASGVASFEFPHLMRLLENNYFDTMYHEHFSYLSLHAVVRIFASCGLRVTHVEELTTHGGSLRVWACRDKNPSCEGSSVAEFLAREHAAGLLNGDTYRAFQTRIEALKDCFLEFLISEKRAGRKVAAYGAAAKGNTLLNFSGVRRDLLHFVVDRSPGKVGKFLPGSAIPIVNEEFLRLERPDTIVILPWNLKDEISSQLAYARVWEARFVVALPKLEVI